MLFNKNNYRKAGEKKVLHKVGKEWKVVSVALLMAVAGGAVATHANANASQTDDQNNSSVNTLVDQLNASGAANAPRIAQKQPVQKQTSAKSASSEALYYYPGSNGSAASYFDKAANESGNANKYYTTVNNYVQSLNDEYGVEVSSFANSSVSASSAASNDSKLANAYSAVAKNPSTTNTINSLAAKNRTTPMLYEGMVENQEQVYSGEVKSASGDVKANNDVASLVNRLANTDFSGASLNASASSVIAQSNLTSAYANRNSVESRFGGINAHDAENFVDVANKLSAGANTLQVIANGGTYQADYDQLTAHMNSGEEATLNSNLASDINSAVTSQKSDITSLVSSAMSINVSGSVTPALAAYANDKDYGNVLGFNDFYPSTTKYSEAVSAAADNQVAPALASAATVLYGKYNPEYADADTLQKEASAAIQSANNEVTAMSYAAAFADRNSFVVSSVSNDVANVYKGASATAQAYLNEGINTVANSLGLIVPNNNITENDFANQYINDIITGAQKAESNNLNGALVDGAQDGSNRKDQLNQVIAAGVNTLNNGNTSDIKNNVSQVSNWMNDLQKFSIYTGHSYMEGVNAYDADKDANSPEVKFQKAVVNAFFHYFNNSDNDAFDKAPAINNHTMFHGEYMQHIATAISDAISTANNNLTKNVNKATTEFDNTTILPDRAIAFATSAALLSDGVDMNQLESESANIANIKAAVNANEVAAPATESTGEKFTNALSAASDSATSALGTAQNASASYATANDENVTLSSYFASSFATEASSEANVSSNASSGLNAFFKSMASDGTFNSADDAYNTAENAAVNDYKLGAANAKSIYNRSAHFLDVTKGASLHTTPNFNTGKDKVVAKANKGDRLTVYGVNVSRNNQKRGVVRYFVLDNTTGKKGFITGQPNYTTPAYLSAVAEHQNVQIKTLKPVRVYSDLASKKYVGTVPAGKVLDNATVVYGNATEDAHGFTKVETASNDFLTANTAYVAIVAPTVQTNNNNNNTSYNYDLQNNNLDFDKYFNTYTED